MQQPGKHYIEDKEFEKINFAEEELPKGEYDRCVFTGCVFTETTLSGSIFSECTFTGCNLSMSKLSRTTLKEVTFKDSKLLGVRFDNCSNFLFTVHFDNCMLNLSSFYKRNLRKTIFRNCSMRESDLCEADLTSALLDNCDLSGALFERTILEKADLRTAYNFNIDPEQNKITKARFSVNGLPGLLARYNIEIER
jgi:fluoroquinolone resistance protein